MSGGARLTVLRPVIDVDAEGTLFQPDELFYKGALLIEGRSGQGKP